MADVADNSLSELFESDNIKDHHSNIMIDRVQGYEGLEKKLRTSLKVVIVVARPV